jgi:hypothetical protein
MLVICAKMKSIGLIKIIHGWGMLVNLVQKEWEMKLLIDIVGKTELYRWIYCWVVKDVN